ncbi:glycosyltransferase family 39 protein [Patescibacteria group bacterium]|nr:glycosyltransferase family 39 protein [Patescibacteria group bacterium]
MTKKLTEPLFMIFILALALRWIGSTHGFPFIFHPDEPTIVREALNLRFTRNPGHFDWPHLYMYLNYFLFMFFAKLRDLAAVQGLKPYLSANIPILWNDNLVFYLLARLLSGFFGALTVIPVYYTGKVLFDKKTAIISAFIFSVLPFHVWHSHYSMGDVPMVFFIALNMYFSAKIFKENEAKNYLLAGLSIGLASSVKYNAVLLCLTVPLAHIFRILNDRKEKFFNFDTLMNLVFSGLCAIAGFVAGTPYAVMDYKTFLISDSPKGALWQFVNVGSVDSSQRFTKFFTEMVHRVSDDVGYVVLAAFFIVLAVLLYKLAVRKFSKKDYTLWYLVIPPFISLVYVSGFDSTRSHYYMIAYPFLAVVYAYIVCYFSSLVKKSYMIEFFSVVLLIFPLFYFSVIKTYIFAREDTRNVLFSWANQHVDLNTPIISGNDEYIYMVLSSKYKNIYKGYSSYSISPFGLGYLVVAVSDESPKQAFERFTYLPKLNLVYSINNTYRRGPFINIYEYRK